MGRKLRSHNKAIRKPDAVIKQLTNKFPEALSLHQTGQLEAAKALYTEILEVDPNHFDCLHLLGVALWQTGKAEAGVQMIKRAISLTADYPPAYNNMGNALRDLGCSTEALECYDTALRLNPDYPEAYNNRGNALRDLGRSEEALRCYEKAISIRENFVEAWNNLGNVLTDLRRPAEALVAYEAAIGIKAEFAEAHSNRGQALLSLKRYHDAEMSCRRAILQRPNFADAYNNLGATLKELRRLDEAIECYNRAIDINPKFKEALNNRGIALAELKRFDEAIQSYSKAIEIDQNYAAAYSNKGNAERDLRRYKDAITSYRKSLDLAPESDFLYGTYLQTKLKVCDWSTLDADIETVKEAISAKKKVINPFVGLIVLDDPKLHLEAAKMFGNAVYPDAGGSLLVRRTRSEKIRIGYFSADYFNHATSFLMAQLIEFHDRERFEVYGFTFSPKVNDELQRRMYAAFDEVIDVTDMSDREVASHSRDLGIDIAVDLKGYTTDARTGIFAERCAPIQVSYLGYPGTMGIPYMDYVMVDSVVVPIEEQCNYTEKLACLPNSYQVNDSCRPVSSVKFSRGDVGLPEEGFVFCCFNNNHKILPEMFSIWMDLLKQVPNSVLWLLEDNPEASYNLRREAESQHVQAERLIFAKRTKIDEHLARHVLADLFLDTLPYNAHTTASDALWSNVPVLTLLGKAFAGRVAASLLTALDLPELICRTVHEYRSKALEFATDPLKLEKIRQKIMVRKVGSPLFDARIFTQQVEELYTRMAYDREMVCLREL